MACHRSRLDGRDINPIHTAVCPRPVIKACCQNRERLEGIGFKAPSLRYQCEADKTSAMLVRLVPRRIIWPRSLMGIWGSRYSPPCSGPVGPSAPAPGFLQLARAQSRLPNFCHASSTSDPATSTRSCGILTPSWCWHGGRRRGRHRGACFHAAAFFR